MIAGAVVLFLIVLGALTGRSDSTSTTSQGSTFQQASSVDAPPPPTGPVTRLRSGHVRGKAQSVVPGTYSSNGADGTNFVGCYWSRLKDTTGDFGSIIANNIGKGPAVVTISASDGAFTTEGCSTWHKR